MVPKVFFYQKISYKRQIKVFWVEKYFFIVSLEQRPNKIKMTIADQWSLTSDHRAEPKVTKWSQCVSMCLAKNQHLVTIDFQHSVNEWPPSIEQVITCGPKVVNEWSKGSTDSATKWSLHCHRLPTKLSHSEHLVKWPPRSHQGA